MKNIFFIEQNYTGQNLSGLLINSNGKKSLTTKWRFNLWERIKILFFGNLWITIKDEADISLSIDKPFEKV